MSVTFPVIQTVVCDACVVFLGKKRNKLKPVECVMICGDTAKSWCVQCLSHMVERLEDGPPYDPEFGDDKECVCGHPYHRHFDPYADNRPVGCKYCQCDRFQEKT